jgi:hypothetical protein
MTNFTVTVHGIELSFLIAILIAMVKQYTIYKGVRERLNILWRVYCKEHKIPYNALGDDMLVDLISDKDNFLRIGER